MKDFVAYDVIRKTMSSVQNGVPGVYKMLSAQNRLLYVGKARDLRNRLGSYLSASKTSDRVMLMVRQITNIEVTLTENEAAALLLEAKLIKSLKPKYNIIMRDDKFYPYIALSRHRYPRISFCREKKGEVYARSYGPFLSSVMTKHIIAAIKRAFLLRSCSDSFFATRSRPCIEYEIRNCSAPCMNKVSERDYLDAVQMAHRVLIGKSKEIQRELLDSMQKYSDNLDYESAIVCRDRIHALRSMQECTAFQTCINEDSDFLAIYQRNDLYCMQIISFRGGASNCSQPYFFENVGNAREFDIASMFMLQMLDKFSSVVYVNFVSCSDLHLIREAIQMATGSSIEVRYPRTSDEQKVMSLARSYAMEALNNRVRESSLQTELEELKVFFNLIKIPERIEVYDNSHISGSHPCGVMIVHGQDGFLKKEYRKFKIKTVVNGDDYSMMREVIYRRFSEISEIPDFILIDGGRGHVSSAYEKLITLGIPFACIAKGPGRVKGTESVYSFDGKKLPINRGSLLYSFLIRLRDEAHRFAITSHRRSRDCKLQFTTELDHIPGIGKTRTKALLAYFGTVSAIKCARICEIGMVPGISPKLAERISKHLKNV